MIGRARDGTGDILLGTSKLAGTGRMHMEQRTFLWNFGDLVIEWQSSPAVCVEQGTFRLLWNELLVIWTSTSTREERGERTERLGEERRSRKERRDVERRDEIQKKGERERERERS